MEDLILARRVVEGAILGVLAFQKTLKLFSL